MITAVGAAPQGAPKAPVLPPLPAAGALITALAVQAINLGTGICLIGYGLKEIILDSHPTWLRFTPKEGAAPLIQKTVKAVDWLLVMVRNQPLCTFDKFRFTVHGLLMVGTGAAGSVSALGRLGWLAVGSALQAFDTTAGVLFLGGNIIYLEYNIEKFIEAAKEIRRTGCRYNYAALRLTAASIGIVSNFAYMGASAATFAQAPFVCTLVLGGVGLGTGGLRILLESYISWRVQN